MRFALVGVEMLKTVAEVILAIAGIYAFVVPDPIGTTVKLWRGIRNLYRTLN